MTGEDLPLIDEGDPPRRLRAGDRIILARDGVQTLSPDEVARTCAAEESASETVSKLVRRVEAAGRSHQDNATVVVYRHAGSGAVRRRFSELEAPTRPMRRSGRT